MTSIERRECLAALMEQTPEWIAKSLANPNQYMSATCLALHKIALRRKGGRNGS